MSVSEHPMLAASVNTIGILSEETINQIAAGELIDRPCAVVKELIENAVDAGSTAVTIDIVNGGKQLIRVSDDGEGIPPFNQLSRQLLTNIRQCGLKTRKAPT